ncbi:MAG: universal stress protein [Ilumatobacteraceae bacterium]
MTRVLIAVDDSDTSLAAAQTAYRLFGDEAEYTVINVAENSPVEWGDDSLRYGTVYPLTIPGAGVVGGVPFVIRSSSSSDLDSDRVDLAEQTADDIARAAGLPHAEPMGDTGDPAEAIVAAATTHNADVIVVGTHERGWFKRLVSSSVSGAVIRDSEIPVLVAR